jgi:hypothetical protein
MKTLLWAFISVGGVLDFFRRAVSCSIFLHCAPKRGNELQTGKNNFLIGGWVPENTPEPFACLESTAVNTRS